VILQEPPLPLRKRTDIELALRRDPHAHERGAISDGRDDEIAVALEGDESLVEEVIDRGGEQESVLAVEALLVRAVASGLGVTCDQVFGPLDIPSAACGRVRVRAPAPSLAAFPPWFASGPDCGLRVADARLLTSIAQ
jgi:hypothetical protein